MSEFEEKPEPSSSSGPAELQEEVRSLRTMLSASLILLIVFGLSVDLFLFKQVSVLGADADRYEQGINGFNAPKARDFWNRLVAYSRTHPEFAPVINKFSPTVNYTLFGNPGPTP